MLPALLNGCHLSRKARKTSIGLLVLGSGREVRRRDDEGKVLGGITIKKAKVILFDDYEVLTNSEGGGTEMKHQTVVPCGSYHPKDWKTGCCEGVGECTNQCSLPYNC